MCRLTSKTLKTLASSASLLLGCPLVIHLNDNSGVFKGIGSIRKLIEEFENGGTELREVELKLSNKIIIFHIILVQLHRLYIVHLTKRKSYSSQDVSGSERFVHLTKSYGTATLPLLIARRSRMYSGKIFNCPSLLINGNVGDTIVPLAMCFFNCKT
jgi:hypothetical protein